MKRKCAFFGALMFVYSSISFGANDGLINRVDFSGGNSYWGDEHSNLVQIKIEGGFEAENCSSEYAAIRKSETHLISAVLAAFSGDKRITVFLSKSEKYYNDRCIITDLFINK
ncbi:hypothetical protein [Endozoicomonas arenosclerae]|uniref:hypothetical protein n=1 Tax=Endozoicomonas arenosclerae TaxID=1633495 RepID=UPI0007821330|nr:hypothetical protein [Endozoicomonas arenosclerae]